MSIKGREKSFLLLRSQCPVDRNGKRHGIDEDEQRKEVIKDGGEGVKQHGGDICRENDS